MQFSTTIALAALAAAARACSQCPHPGNFTGFVTQFAPNPNYCGTAVSDVSYSISVPATYYNPPDESPCDAPVNVTNICTGKVITAMVVGKCTTCSANDIQLTGAAISALGSPKIVEWTFD
ncbi:hypothetical protein MMC17_003246 [Xylographa soralifera]|nr:hypothetical protein [Xylographa soralifera]